MSKRTIGDICCLIGAAPAYGIMALVPSGSSSFHPAHLCWLIPTTIVTLPLLPFYFLGEKMIAECDKADFNQTTDNLPKVHLPKEYIAIEYSDPSKVWCVTWWGSDKTTTFLEGDYPSIEEATSAVKAHGFHEVVSLDHEYYWGTFWIK